MPNDRSPDLRFAVHGSCVSDESHKNFGAQSQRCVGWHKPLKTRSSAVGPPGFPQQDGCVKWLIPVRALSTSAPRILRCRPDVSLLAKPMTTLQHVAGATLDRAADTAWTTLNLALPAAAVFSGCCKPTSGPNCCPLQHSPPLEASSRPLQ